ncbi:D-alanine--poly(phosphoribitol) ligase subunit DltC [Anaerosacchariphilus polymeriproducens]|uniref:D-alanyl carrier protein n=1 Tax=Anaerosacchariphilus polymeriproducens TaxID=1812858 RepID=A0A371ARR3_9FIRM|nr:D-alanine--poly(phosphoribitol) ligase subunit DltC [Anaerosacchariphilus polymeriproducens]RDU22269.1 D-alanine--poly(phosphoribitol) ligase subunit DltC [Anaerosacchariphilus polymeriproducens]
MEKELLELLEKVCEDSIVKEDLDVELFESDLLDSLGFAELLAEIELTFGVFISPSEIERSEINTPNKIIAMIKARS